LQVYAREGCAKGLHKTDKEIVMFAKPRPEQEFVCGRRGPRRWLAIPGLLALWLLLTTTPLFAANPPPVQIFYIPAPEDDGFNALKGIYPTAPIPPPNITEPIVSFTSISVIANGTIIYYDHWEDGYEIDISNPTQASTQIWGDGNPANGAPPGFPADTLGSNSVIILNDEVFLATRQSVIDFDGGDKFGASRSIAVTRAFWDTGASTLLAAAFEVYPTDEWGTSFLAPVGTDSPSPSLFEYTSLLIMATDDDTTVQVDVDANGAFEDVVTLDEGESHLTVGTVQEGARVQASAPVQVGLITGDIGDKYEGRTFVLFPEEQWSDAYYSPVSPNKVASGGGPQNGTTAFLYNPHSTPLTVTRTTLGNTTLNVVIQPTSGISVPIPLSTGVSFVSTDGRPFAALAAVDSTDPPNANSLGDWGFAMIPEDQLTMQTLIGWGPGSDPTSNLVENSSPVWVIPVDDGSTVDICVDYDADNAGPLQDLNGFRYDQRLTLTELQNARVFDSDGNQTGMLLYVCPTAPNQAVTSKLAAAWGQDPDIATPGEPGLDLGTTAPPASTFEAGKSADIIGDVDGDGKADGGDTLRYTVIVRNASRVPINGVTISDTIPLNTSYVLSSTTVNTGTGTIARPDNGVGTPFPLDEGGIALGDLPVNGIFTVTFAVLLDNPLPPTIDRVRNVAIVRANGEERKPEVETPIDFDPSLNILKATNGVDANTPPGVLVRAGSNVTWTYTVTNTGAISITSLSVTDSDPGVMPLLIGGDGGEPGLFEVGESRLYRAVGVAIAGQYSNTATAVGVAANGEAVTDTDVSHYFGVLSAIDIEKQASAAIVRSGTPVTYSYAVSSTSNVPLVNVAVGDDRCLAVTPVVSGTINLGDTDADNALDVGELWQYTCTTPLTTTTTNIATVSAVDPLSTTVTATDTATISVTAPAIDLEKTVSRPYVRANTSVVYTFTVENSGTGVLTDVVLLDNQCAVGPASGDEGADGLLQIAETWTYTCTRVITRTTTNVAVVTAIDLFGEVVTDTDTARVIVPILYLPWIVKQEEPIPCPPPNGCPLANEIKAMAVNETTNRLYVVARNPDELLLVNPVTNAILDRAGTGAQPWGIAIDEATNRVYVSSFAGGDVRIYDGATLDLLATLAVGDNPTLAEHLPGTNTIFVLVRGGSRVAIIDGLSLVQNISSGGSAPFGIAADAVNQRIFISHRESSSLSMLRKVGDQWQAFMGPQVDDDRQFFEIAYASANNRLFALWADPNSNWFLDVWEPKDNDIWGRFSTQGIASGGDLNDPNVGGAGLDFNPATGNLFNVNTGADSLSVFDSVTLGEVGSVVLGDDPFAITVDGTRNQVYLGLRDSGRLIKLADTY
jgi:uncharacterized repeat protein (TIGR01451 family)